MIGGNINQRYKTMICRHWEQTGQCQMGQRCHFAHGKEELRQPSDPLPTTGISLKANSKIKDPSLAGAGYGMPYSNYKTVKCKYFDQGTCKYGENCSFAHGETDMRSFQDNPTAYPMPAYPGFVPTQTQMYSPIMSEINAKIMQLQLQYLIFNLMQYKKEDVTQQNLKIANDLLNVNNITSCVQVLNEIMYNQNATFEEKEFYKALLAEAQNVGNQYLQSCVNPAANQMNNFNK